MLNEISGAYTAIKATKELISAVLGVKIDEAAREKIHAAFDQLGTVQDTLFYLREELSRLQTENHELREKMRAAAGWDAKIAEYKLEQTAGGAVVHRSLNEPKHYICPSCVNKKEIQILQGRKGSMSGDLTCPGCNKRFPVEVEVDLPESRDDENEGWLNK